MYLRDYNGYPGFVADENHADTDIQITDADYARFFDREKSGKVFRMRATPDTQSGLFGCIEEYVPEPIGTQPSEIQLLQLALAEAIEKQEADKLESQIAQAEAVEKQEADKLELQLALAEFIESQVTEGGV